MNRIVMTLATLALITTLFAGSAIAHANFVSSSPAPGQTVAAAPANVSITFSEDLAAASIGIVVNAAATRVSTGSAVSTADRKVMTITLPPGLPSGTYSVLWHSISADDGDPLDGTFSFNVGTAPAPARTLPSTSTLPESDSAGLVLALLAILLLIGTLSFRASRGTQA